ncbi:hypothetical protein MO867_04115 [Microbulbifer sp. OS29]|uniref:Uncharacterized protein n=1 Tax=Microbulbifer okhotskensis TaxID=2926617 RepID=A0A9X2EL13_9GAMM|nr:hypothetical protein [Microbulbifer okhotskensis]MCO1333520.1 hypothetical protein [Microbulbifer okhotskensis]
MSDWLPVIIIGFAMVLVLGPVMWLKPNARDSRLAGMRSQAARAGITVQIQALPAALGDGTAAVYYHRWQNPKGLQVGWILELQRIEHELNFSGQWDWAKGQPAPKDAWKYLHALLGELPRDICAITATQVGLGVQWRESGGDTSFQKLMSSLDKYSPLIEEAIRKMRPSPTTQELS